MNKEQKIIITNFQTNINFYLEKGWRIISVTAGHITTTIAADNHSYIRSNKDEITIHGNFCFVIEK